MVQGKQIRPSITLYSFDQGRIQGGAMGAMPPPQDADVAFWSTAIILIQ